MISILLYIIEWICWLVYCSAVDRSDVAETLKSMLCDFFYFVQWPTNAQLIDKLLYCSYMFRYYCVIFREFVVRALLQPIVFVFSQPGSGL